MTFEEIFALPSTSPGEKHGYCKEKDEAFEVAAGSIVAKLGSNQLKVNQGIKEAAIERENEFKKIEDGVRKAYEVREAREEEKLRMLRAIKQNTDNLPTIIELIDKGNDQQDEILAIVTGMFAILKEKTEKEARMTFRKLLDRVDKIGKIPKHIDTAKKLADLCHYLFPLILDKINGKA